MKTTGTIRIEINTDMNVFTTSPEARKMEMSRILHGLATTLAYPGYFGDEIPIYTADCKPCGRVSCQ